MEPGPLPAGASAGIYIHIPFCSHICPYCDFTTYAGKTDLIPRYVDSIERDLTAQAPQLADRAIRSIFIGGGTPSLLSGAQMARIIAACRANFAVARDAEVTTESNPNGLDAALLSAYWTAGLNRLSIGAQTLDRRGLRTLGRQHEASAVDDALSAARLARFERVSLDLIFGWPGQSLDSWRNDLTTVLQHPAGPDHLSLYSLIVEPGTPFADAQARGILRMPDDDAAADLYELAIDVLADAGWTHYEIANWSRDPSGYSRHNALYWQHGDYVGIGAGAHGTVGAVRTINHLLPETYCAAIENGQPAAANVETIDEATQRAETMLLGLRLLGAGIDRDAFAMRHGIPLAEAYGQTITSLLDIGMVERIGNRLRLTTRGMMLANDVVARFL